MVIALFLSLAKAAIVLKFAMIDMYRIVDIREPATFVFQTAVLEAAHNIRSHQNQRIRT